MKERTFRKYIWSCIWLILPPMLILAMVSPLPRAYQSDLFWRDIPRWVAFGENMTRALVVTLPAFMPFSLQSRQQRSGLALYLFGLALYWVAWRSPVWFAGTALASHPVVFMAPAWTPWIWLAGISLIGNRFYFSGRYRPWMYLAASSLFSLFHSLHAWIVWLRIARPAVE